MAFRVEPTARAKQDLDAILEWLLAQEAGDAGLRWFQGMREASFSLAEFPQRGAVAPESAEFPFEVRQLIYGHKPHFYRILFTIEHRRDNRLNPDRSRVSGNIARCRLNQRRSEWKLLNC